jgi:hypothetical protein
VRLLPNAYLSKKVMAMFDPMQLIRKAYQSPAYLFVLNLALYRMIPFNRPHGFRVKELSQYRIKTIMPYKRRNFNHIRGLHACGLATLTEFTTGLLLLSNLGFDRYRIIMQRLEMDYHFQGKMDAFAEFAISQEWLDENIVQPLQTQDSVVVPCALKITDARGNHLTTGKVFWQFKDWSKVKTKV